MANSNELYDTPRPTLAKVVLIGGIGMEVKDTKPLPEEILKIVESRDATILFSFGSIAPSHNMPLEWKRSFVEAFKKFPNYNFLWRYEKDDIKAILPPNVYLYKWLPQTDLLRHSKTKAFITHAGYNSIQEAINIGMPVITVPLYGDQPRNALLAKHHGFGLILQKSELSAESISKAIEEIVSNKKYFEAAKRLSKMVEHKPVSPAQLLVKWSEFVAKFKTLENLEPAGNKLNFFQYHSLDVIFTLLIVLIISLTVTAALFRCLLHRIFAKYIVKSKKE
ncbi:unnamed protein product [Strongylus vulgaris]|uniref:UDP-glucuronosyltransferase n=1 Tax=Strongylus vulgaris TaxID=40348 RepID=A0A3P7KLU3_STRVU|nr:unnamed protein product [Strongylus vulgaris]